MKKLNFIALAIIGLYACLNFSSCKKDDDGPNISLMKGVWDNGKELNPSEGNGDRGSMLITDNVWLWEDSAKLLWTYRNASFEELAKHFAPDVNFCIYRYDNEKDVYILYESCDFINGELNFYTDWFLVAKVNISNETMHLELYYVTTKESFTPDELPLIQTVTYKELMNDDKYAILPNNIDLGNPDYITYTRYKQ